MIRLSKAYFRSVEKDLVREGRGRKPIYPYWLIFTLIAIKEIRRNCKANFKAT